jgi:hypothetical protein
MDKFIGRFKAMSVAEKVIITAGVLLFVVGFLPWYSISIGPISWTANGWESPGAMWSILAILIGLAMASAVALRNLTEVEIPDNLGGLSWPKILLGGGVAAVVLLLIKLLNESSNLGFAFYVGIIAAAGLAAAGFLMYREEGAV